MKWINIFTNIIVLISVNLFSLKDILEMTLIILSIILTLINITIHLKQIYFKDEIK